MRRVIYIRVAPLVAMAALLLTGCGTSEKTSTLTQRADDRVQLVFLDLNPAGDTGDLTTFEAGLYLDDEPYGAIMGTMTKVGSVGAGANPNREERLLTAVFDLPEGQIRVQGVSYYFEDDTLLAPGQPMTRAIIGGTGDYVGVDREATTTRNPDNSYTHVLSIVN